MSNFAFLGYTNWCPTCSTQVIGLHICTGYREIVRDQPLVRLAEDDIERIAQRVAELVSPKKRSAEQ